MILEAVGNALPISIGIAISPFAIAALLIILMTARARTNAPAFLLGWILGFLIVGFLADFIPFAQDSTGESKPLPGLIRVALGLVLLISAVWQWRRQSASDEKVTTPRLLARLDNIGVFQSMVTGFLLSAVHPKNLPLIVAGVAAIQTANLTQGGENVAFLVFTILSSLTILLPIAGYFLAKEKAEVMFGEWKSWLITNNGIVMILLFLFLGTLLIGRGMRMLSI